VLGAEFELSEKALENKSTWIRARVRPALVQVHRQARGRRTGQRGDDL
jgi:hypothetical protein